MRGEASSLSRASGGRPRLPPSGAQAAVQLQGCTNSAGQGRTPSKLDKLALSTSDEEVGVPAGSASVVRGGSGSSAWLSRRSRIAVAIAATVLVLSVTVAVVVGVTQAQKSKGSGGDGGSGSLSGASVPPSPPAALAPPQYAMQPPPTRPSPKAAVPPPLRSPAQPPPISAPAAPPASPPAAPRPPVPQLPPPQLSPAPAPTAAPFPVPAGSVALWGDEFAGGSLDSDTWAYDLGAPASAVNAGQLQVRRCAGRGGTSLQAPQVVSPARAPTDPAPPNSTPLHTTPSAALLPPLGGQRCSPLFHVHVPTGRLPARPAWRLCRNTPTGQTTCGCRTASC